MQLIKINQSCLAHSEESTYSFIPHVHESIELVYIAKGSARINIDEKEYVVQSNSFVVVFPFQIHSYNNAHDNTLAYIMYCSPKNLQSSIHLFANSVPSNPIVTNLGEELDSLLSEIRNGLNDSSTNKNLQYQNTINLFKQIISLLSFKNKADTNLTTTQLILNYCYKNFKEPLTLDQLSKDLSINKFYISHIFNNKLNIGFTDYLAMLRVDEAKKLLKHSDTSITNIAYDVGFSTIRSFNRRFKEFSGITPKEYRSNEKIYT